MGPTWEDTELGELFDATWGGVPDVVLRVGPRTGKRRRWWRAARRLKERRKAATYVIFEQLLLPVLGNDRSRCRGRRPLGELCL